jgi:hypothetical protein
VLDGRPLSGTTPLTMEVADVQASHVLELRLSGYQRHSQKLSFPPGGSRLRLYINLEPLHGTLHVRTLPSGAQVLINGVVRGRSPVTIEGLPTSEKTVLEVRKPGHRSVSQPVDWEGQTNLFLEITLPRRP